MKGSLTARKTVKLRWMARRKKAPSIVGMLPGDAIVEIVGRLAARSPTPVDDLHRLRATCKTLYAASKERCVGKRIAVEKEKSMSWWQNERYTAVITHCAVAGNVEASFILAMKLIFKAQDMKLGMLYLDHAANAGHKTAAYVLGLLFYTKDDTRIAGMRHFNRIEGEYGMDDVCSKIRRTNRQCRQCRRHAADIVRDVAWSNPVPQHGPSQPVLLKPGRCKNADCGTQKGWADYSGFCSDVCRIEHEHAQFFTKIQKYLPR